MKVLKEQCPLLTSVPSLQPLILLKPSSAGYRVMALLVSKPIQQDCNDDDDDDGRFSRHRVMGFELHSLLSCRVN